MNQVISRKQLAQFIAQKVITEPSKRQHWTEALAAYLIQQGKTHELNIIVNDITEALFVLDQRLNLTLTSAYPLKQQLKDDITSYFRQHTGAKHVSVNEVVNERIIGGFIARTTESEMDMSVKSKLLRLQNDVEEESA